MCSKNLNAGPLSYSSCSCRSIFTSIKDLSTSFNTDLLRKPFFASLVVFDLWWQYCESMSIVQKHAGLTGHLLHCGELAYVVFLFHNMYLKKWFETLKFILAEILQGLWDVLSF